MARDQQLPLNPEKLSGPCGRLLCCLQFEHTQYLDLLKDLPRKNARVCHEGSGACGKVTKLHPLAGTVDVTTDQGGGTPTITFKQDGEKLTGKYNGQLGSADLTGSVKGSAIHFTFTLDVQGQQAPVTYDGTIEKNTMKGKMDIGGMVNGTFTATKK